MNPEILDYIRANRARYYREAITAQLIAAGHEQGAVDEAWAAVSAEVEAAAGPNPWPRFRRAFLLTGLVGLAAAFVTWSLAYGTYVNAGYGVVATGVLLVFLVVPLVVGAAIVAVALRRASPSVLFGLALWVPIVLVGVSAGACVALGLSDPTLNY